MISSSFWQGKKVLITGHTGFKGGWLSLWLKQLGANVIGFALPPATKPNFFSLAKVQHCVTSVIGDVRDAKAVLAVVKKHQPEIVFHLAALPLVLVSYEQPIETYATNVMGTVHLFEALRQTSSARAIINVTTDKCYENKEWIWGYRERDRLGGHDPYSNSKACSELVTNSFRDAYFKSMNIGIASARAGNVLGGGDWSPHRLIPDLIQGCIHQKVVRLRHPEAYRPWQHVLEPLSGYLLLAECLYESPHAYSEGWNFGPDLNEVKSVRWIADCIYALFKNEKNWQKDEAHYSHEMQCLMLDAAKAKTKLGWHPRWLIEKGLEKTVEWYQAYVAEKNMQQMTLDQITEYILLQPQDARF